MTAHLQPKPGFNWMAVSWGGPEEPRTERCSYCEAKLPDITDDGYAVPLIIWTRTAGAPSSAPHAGSNGGD